MSNPDDVAVHLSAVSGVRFAKVLYILNGLPTLLGSAQERDAELPLELAEVRGKVMWVSRIMLQHLVEAGDLELEILIEDDTVEALADALTDIAEFIDGPHFQLNQEMPYRREDVISTVDNVRAAAHLLQHRRPLTPELPGAITYTSL